jgi:uncharacterized protein YeaC (DUF1315 family)
MKASGHARWPQGVDRALSKCQPQSYLQEVVATEIRSRQEGGNQEGDSKTIHGWFD